MRPSALVVDDEPALRAVARAVLEGDGWRVSEAADGDEALALHRPGAFEVVVLDLRMPRRDGLETLFALRAAEPGLGVVLVRGTATLLVLDAVIAHGRAVFLPKPFDAGQLLCAVAEVATPASPPRPR